MSKPVVTYRIEVEPDDNPVRGNCMASGDDAADKAYEDEIIRRLDNGEVWAWAVVKVVAECEGFEGHDYLCGCTYKDEKDFIQGNDYYPDMKAAALADLLVEFEEAKKTGARVDSLLKALRGEK